MPTALEFDLLAADFDRLAETAAQLMEPAARCFADGVLIGGRLTRDMGDVLEHCRNEMATAAAELQGAAAECRHRAEVCRTWTEAMQRWRLGVKAAEQARADWTVRSHLHQLDPAVHPPPGPVPEDPIRPPQPAPWAEL